MVSLFFNLLWKKEREIAKKATSFKENLRFYVNWEVLRFFFFMPFLNPFWPGDFVIGFVNRTPRVWVCRCLLLSFSCSVEAVRWGTASSVLLLIKSNALGILLVVSRCGCYFIVDPRSILLRVRGKKSDILD